MDADRSSWVVHWSGMAIVAVIGIACGALFVPTGRVEAQQRPPQAQPAQAQQPAAPAGQRPNILVIFGDDIGQTNISAYSFGLMGYKTPNIDRIAREGMMFTDYYAEQSCTAGRSSFITGQCTLRTGLSKVYSRRNRGAASARCDVGGVAEATWLCDRPVRQEPPR